MKARLVLSALFAILLGGALNSLAQGTFAFYNNGATAITNGIAGTRATGLTVGMYFSTNTNSPSTGVFVLNPNAMTNLLAPGIFFGGRRTVPGVPAGSYIMVRICAWDTNYPSWEAAGGGTWCRQYVVKGQSDPFVIGPLGDPDGPGPAPTLITAGLRPFTVGVSLATELCPPLVTLTTRPNAVQLRINSNGSFSSVRFSIESSATLASTSWQVRTQFYMPYSPGYPPPSTVVVWTDPQSADLTPRFYRVRASIF